MSNRARMISHKQSTVIKQGQESVLRTLADPRLLLQERFEARAPAGIAEMESLVELHRSLHLRLRVRFNARMSRLMIDTFTHGCHQDFNEIIQTVCKVRVNSQQQALLI